MERLTERSLDYCTQLCSDEDAISCAFYKGEQEEKCWRANMYDRLAAYEDTGLEPDAIEELLAEKAKIENSGKLLAAAFERLKEKVPKWIMIESRPMDKEEREYYSERYDFPLNEDEAVIYCCPLPEHGQEVLVLNRYGRIWLDTFDDDPDYGVGFETNGDMDGIVAWMPLPAPPKGVE